MKRLMICTAAALAVAIVPVIAIAGGCGDGDCSVGALGQGGVASGGAAQGSHFVGEEHGDTIRNSGTFTSGHLIVTTPNESGSISGHLHNDPFDATGHGTGLFGDWS